MKQITESLDNFGLPIAEAKKKKDEPNFEKLLKELMAAVEDHMQIMSGVAEEGVEDHLEACLAATKEALNPEEGEEEKKEEPEAEQELEPEMVESVKKKVVSESSDIESKLKRVPGIEMVDVIDDSTIHVKSWKYANDEDALKAAIQKSTGMKLDLYCDGDDWFVINLE